ncbi:hypothetical protein H5410_023475 [Solanum commersonii]|uniref:Uncharacterized protein n=1 Tax=Solanum commersonii TaxID=4109 RepID=A0A9J5ZHP0_SOLCO|nr:hypothetical protein H5410_023475 [Solanum commersonii]
MVVIPTVTGLSTGARLLSVPRTIATAARASPSSLPSLCYLKKSYYSPQRRSVLPARKLVIRAAKQSPKAPLAWFQSSQF